ncbi:MAG TPA: N-acetylmuramoyl-L-alanine amidase, partial [Vicinamibacterales bacterium]|nr:N-acetylmuramoyl-L-alanine amidase [Vicinamibacterales bacterium]
MNPLSAGELTRRDRLESLNEDVHGAALRSLRTLDESDSAAPGAAKPTILGTSVSVNADGDTVVTLNLTRSFLEQHPADGDLEAAVQALETEIGNVRGLETAEERQGNLGFEILIESIPLERYLPPTPTIPERQNRVGTDAVANTRITISPGHGWYWNETGRNWALQRSYFYGIVEDYVNSEITAYLRSELSARGMDVRPTRELSKSNTNGETGHPRWQEDARYYLRSIGAPTTVTNATSSSDYNRDIMARPLYSNWVGASLMVSVHNNGATGTATGTEVWYSNTNGSITDSKRLAEAIHTRLITALRQYNPKWVDRG